MPAPFLISATSGAPEMLAVMSKSMSAPGKAIWFTVNKRPVLVPELIDKCGPKSRLPEMNDGGEAPLLPWKLLTVTFPERLRVPEPVVMSALKVGPLTIVTGPTVVLNPFRFNQPELLIVTVLVMDPKKSVGLI